jgi:septal ring factor EnvC (AmiA/AmiB activator)
MGILNPLLAIIPLIEEGKGKDSNCGQLIAEATKSAKQSAASGATTQKQKEKKQEKESKKDKAPAAAPEQSSSSGGTVFPPNPGN